MEITELNHAKVLSHLPERDAWAHKGSFGRILLLCGSRGYTGAAALAAMGALRVGAGLVYLGVPECIYAIEAVKLTEPIVLPLACEGDTLSAAAQSEILRLLPKMDAVLAGPGLGQSEGTLAAVRCVLENTAAPVVLDADGINLLAAHMDILRGRTGTTILTPHDGEFLRFGCALTADRAQCASALAERLGAIVVLKGHETIITDAKACCRNRTGNPGMAVGGSGDVLAGMIAGLLGQGIEPFAAASCAVWLHGAAGDLCAEALGQYAMLPTDLLGFLPRLLK